MPLPFQSQYAVPRRLDAVAAEDIEVDRRLGPRRDQDLDRWRGRTGCRFTQQQRGWAEIDGKAGHHRTVVDVATVAEQLDVGPHRQRVSVEPVGFTAKIDGDLPARSRRDRLPHHLRVAHQGNGGAFHPLREEEAEQLDAVPRSSAPRVVRDIDQNQRTADWHVDVFFAVEGVDQLGRVLEAGDPAQEPIAQRPCLRGELVCQLRGQVRVVIRGDQDAESGVRIVPERKPAGDRDVDDPRILLDDVRSFHQRPHRHASRRHPLRGGEHRRLAQRRRGADLAAHESSQDRGRLFAALGHIDVRVGVVADQHVGELHHPRRDVGMKVESRDHRHIRTDDLSHGLQDVAVSVVVDLGDHGAMQGEEDAIERAFRPGPPQPVAKQPGQMLDRLRGHQTGRGRPDGQEGYEVESLCLRAGDKAPELGIGIARDFDGGRPEMDARRFERRKIGLHRGEDVGLVRDLRSGDAKRHRLGIRRADSRRRDGARAAQPEQRPHLIWRRQWPAQLGGDASDAGHELGVALGQLAFAIPDVVLQTRAHVSPHGHCRHPQRQLRTADAADRPVGSRGQHLDHVLELLHLRAGCPRAPPARTGTRKAARAAHRRSGATRSRRGRARSTRSPV